MANHDPKDSHSKHDHGDHSHGTHGHGDDDHSHGDHAHDDDHGHGHGDDPGEIIPEDSAWDGMLRMMTAMAVAGLLVFGISMSLTAENPAQELFNSGAGMIRHHGNAGSQDGAPEHAGSPETEHSEAH